MKKQFLVLAGSALLLASCGGNKTESTGQTQAQIDSAINAKVAQHDAEVAAKNDSTLKAVEAEKAAAEARSHGTTHTTSTKSHTEKASPVPTPTTTPTPATPSNPKDSRFNTNPDGSQKPATTDPNAPNKKADRFK